MLYQKRHLDLLREIVLTQLRLKDQATALGMVWSFLHPLIMLTVLVIVFSFKGMGGGTDYYPVYLLSGIVPYTHFAVTTAAGMHVLFGMKQLTGDAVFPKELLVYGAILSRTPEYFLSLLICVLTAVGMGVPLTWNLCLLPFVVLLQLMFVTWVSLWLSCVYLYVRDVDHIYQVILRVLFFLSPIFYTMDFLQEDVSRLIVSLNPLTQLMGFCRAAILPHEFPLRVDLFCYYLVINGILIFISFKAFKRLEPSFAENL